MRESIDCVITTEALAREIESVSAHITATTAAVVGMQAAVISAEQMAADEVCNKLNAGFYTLIHSQISQKIAQYTSTLNSHLMKLRFVAGQLQGIQKQMEHDYTMLAERYLKIFTALNNNLEQRIAELERLTIDFVQIDAASVLHQTQQLPPILPVTQAETIAESQHLQLATTKAHTLELLHTLLRFLQERYSQNKLRLETLQSGAHSRLAGDFSLPVIVVVIDENISEVGVRHAGVYLTEQTFAQDVRAVIKEKAKEAIKSATWGGSLGSDVYAEFSRLVMSYEGADRVREKILHLFYCGDTQTIIQ